MTADVAEGFAPPPYPYDRLATLKAAAEERFAGQRGRGRLLDRHAL